MQELVAIAAGGALGALLRYWVSHGVYLLIGRGFPYGTLAVNVIGSLAMGLLYVLLIERLATGPAARAFVLIPLSDIAPNLIHPQSHQSIETMLRDVDRSPVRRISGQIDIPAPPSEMVVPCAETEAEDEPYQYDREPSLT